MIESGTSLGHYRIVRPLGSGGMADVYEAEDEKLGRRVALKVLPPELGRNPDYVKRFEKEVRAAASLNHPGIVTVFEVGQAQGCLFYTMRLLSGGDLADRIRAGLTARQSLALVREVADAFDHAHAHKLVHRDVKPSNILFDERGRAVLTDFGIVKALAAETHLTATGMGIGTPGYMSPEQARGRPVDARADLYALGVILHEMLTGRLPFEAPESLGVLFMHMTTPIPRLPDEHSALQALLDSMMAKDPADRPASAAAVIAMVDALCAPEVVNVLSQPERSIVAAPGADRPKTSQNSTAGKTLAATGAIRWSSRRMVLAGAGLLTALALALGWSINQFAPRHAPLAPEISAIEAKLPNPAPEPIPERIPAPVSEPVRAPSDSLTQVPAAERATIPLPESKSAIGRRDNREDRVVSSRARTSRQTVDPKCDELHMLFGLGQTLSAAQQEYLTEKCR